MVTIEVSKNKIRLSLGENWIATYMFKPTEKADTMKALFNAYPMAYFSTVN